MGNIQRQTIQGTIFTYFGVFLAAVYTTILFPKLLTTEEIGLIGVLMSYAFIVAQISSLGIHGVTTRLFSYFRNEKTGHNGYMTIGLAVITIGYVLSAGGLFLIYHYRWFAVGKNPLLYHYFPLVFVLAFATLYFLFFDNYFKVLYNAVIGTLLKEFAQRLGILLAIILVLFHLISFNAFLSLYVLAVSVPLIVIVSVLIHQNHFHLTLPTKPIEPWLKREMRSVALFSLISSFAGIITLNIDRIMINNMVDLSATGIYTTMFFFGVLVWIPARSLLKTASVYLADAWKNNDLKEIETIQKKSTLVQTIVGLWILGGLWINADSFFNPMILGEKFGSGKYVILFIGLAYLFDMLTGVSGAIITTSKKYKWGAYIIVAQGILIVITNWVFISLYGLVGAAIGSMVSKLIIDMIRLGFIKYQLNIHLFYPRMWWSFLFIAIAFGTASLLPKMNFVFTDILVRSFAFTIVYGILIYVSKISPEINGRINYYVGKH